MKISNKNILGARLNNKNVLGIKNGEYVIYPYVARSNWNIFICRPSETSSGTYKLTLVDNDSTYCSEDKPSYTYWGDETSGSSKTHYYDEDGSYAIKTTNFFNIDTGSGYYYGPDVIELISLRYDFLDMAYLFSGWSQLEKADLKYYDTSKATSMKYLFNKCEKLKSLDLSKWDTSNVTDMSCMFRDCHKLTSIGHLSGWDTSNVTDMSEMFFDCYSLTSLDLSDFDTSNVTGMAYMFYYCSNLTSLDVSGWDTSKVISLGSTFYGCNKLQSVDVSRWNTSNIEWLVATFQDCSSLTHLSVNDFNTSKVVSMSHTFAGCSSLKSLTLSNWKTSNVSIFKKMFNNCSSLVSLDLVNFNTANGEDFTSMFAGCTNLQSLDIRNFSFGEEKITTGSSRRINDFLADCTSLYTLRLDNCDRFTIESIITSANFPANSIDGITRKIYCKRANAGGLKEPTNWQFEFIDVGEIVPGEIYQEGKYEYLAHITEVDVIVNNTHTDLSRMFVGCNDLTTIKSMEIWDTSNVTDMSWMFLDCRSLESLDLSSFDVSNVTEMCGTFADCTNLASLNLSGWNTNKIYDMQQMFKNCSSLTEIDLSGFKPDNIWGLYHTFYGCNYLEVIDLRNFHIANPDIVNNQLTFKDCYRLHTLRLDNCDNTTIKTLIESTEFPTNPIAGVTRKIYCKKENAAGLTEPANWKFEYVD